MIPGMWNFHVRATSIRHPPWLIARTYGISNNIRNDPPKNMRISDVVAHTLAKNKARICIRYFSYAVRTQKYSTQVSIDTYTSNLAAAAAPSPPDITKDRLETTHFVPLSQVAKNDATTISLFAPFHTCSSPQWSILQLSKNFTPTTIKSISFDYSIVFFSLWSLKHANSRILEQRV